MTREEAIEILEHLKNACDEPKWAEAFELAIKALEQLPKLQNRCFVLTHGQLCMFCPYDCENRTTEHRSEE